MPSYSQPKKPQVSFISGKWRIFLWLYDFGERLELLPAGCTLISSGAWVPVWQTELLSFVVSSSDVVFWERKRKDKGVTNCFWMKKNICCSVSGFKPDFPLGYNKKSYIINGRIFIHFISGIIGIKMIVKGCLILSLLACQTSYDKKIL